MINCTKIKICVLSVLFVLVSGISCYANDYIVANGFMYNKEINDLVYETKIVFKENVKHIDIIQSDKKTHWKITFIYKDDTTTSIRMTSGEVVDFYKQLGLECTWE